MNISTIHRQKTPAAKLVFVAHIPVMAIEALLTGFAVLLARRVKPDLFEGRVVA